MSLTQNDLQQIRKIVKFEVGLGTDGINIRMERLENRLKALELTNKKDHQKIIEKFEQKIDQLKTMINEDIRTVYRDLEKLEKKLTRLEARIA